MTQSLALWLIAAGLGVALYAYLGYPLLLKLVSVLRPRPPRALEPADWPLVSITVPAYN